MQAHLIPAPGGEITPSSSAHHHAARSRASATIAAYRSDLRDFSAWVAPQAGVEPLPATPESVSAYLAHLADKGLSASTVARRLAAIGYAHRQAGLPDPSNDERVKAVHAGIRRTLGTAPSPKAAATGPLVIAMTSHCDGSIRGLRDRAILLLGFAGGFRRAELASLELEDLAFTEEGLKVRLRRAKTDQSARREATWEWAITWMRHTQGSPCAPGRGQTRPPRRLVRPRQPWPK